MNTKEKIIFAARHAFLKYGYDRATLQRIAKFSDTSPDMIRYYYRSKDNLFEIVFHGFVEMLISHIYSSDPVDKNLDFEKRNIEYPEMYEVAWFLANEFHTNSEQVFRIMNKNPELRKEFHKVQASNELKEKFEDLIRLNARVIIIKNFLRITNSRDLSAQQADLIIGN